MTLPELINYFWIGNTYEDFCKPRGLNCDAYAIEIFAQKPFGLNSKLEFFKEEETAGKTQYSYNGSEFYSLFNFYYFLNAVREGEKNETLTDIDLALRLLDFAERNG
ncbi:hypothetical protein AM493_08470 [Flavobacterium akiainvivens]|uniref:Uncharacterized protein n=1 Tax=Flavobacterium akiainvivens TaxID=1202724 RepID=A0A0M8MI67_9FLAO|nr:hypothetical protein [Flavobacterium akiainvivens]KOS06068.1 hypothetical protein AM493_08470 [Flavobacterium akiainvivens]SFQ54714.1 hypothetical protein SAMN05444144_107177 [Flavobacterium akiainvivens]